MWKTVSQSVCLVTLVNLGEEEARGKQQNELWENKTKGDRDNVLIHLNQSAKKKWGLKSV